jgi:hypothetical protein
LTIGVLHIDFKVPGARSLKDKRRVTKSLTERMRNRFNCSVSETEYQDLWQRGRVSACVISGDSRHANQQLNEIARFASNHAGAEILDIEIEML